jgi:predicted outer membrane protein
MVGYLQRTKPTETRSFVSNCRTHNGETELLGLSEGSRRQGAELDKPSGAAFDKAYVANEVAYRSMVETQVQYRSGLSDPR